MTSAEKEDGPFSIRHATEAFEKEEEEKAGKTVVGFGLSGERGWEAMRS